MGSFLREFYIGGWREGGFLEDFVSREFYMFVSMFEVRWNKVDL